jgi:hypothetical protein
VTEVTATTVTTEAGSTAEEEMEVATVVEAAISHAPE